MQTKLGSILLIAGTCIGSGMIALPLVLVKLGLIPSIALMLITWVIMYYTSLVNLELNLQAGQGLPLGSLGKLFSGRLAELIGIISLKLLSYSLLSAYIYGGASIMQHLVMGNNQTSYVMGIYAVFCMVILLFPISLIDYLNRILFLGLLSIVTILIGILSTAIDWTYLPLIESDWATSTSWRIAIPVVFTSFGFQVIFHTLTNYCNKNPRILKHAFFWGSFIPVIVYSFWTSGVLSTLNSYSPTFYQNMISGTVDVGSLIEELSMITSWNSLQMLIWWTSFLAITTSVIGVGVGLCDSLKPLLQSYVQHTSMVACLSAVLTIGPAYFIASIVPNAFITILGFAGMILAVIAILLPVYLLYNAHITQFYYPILKNRWLLRGSVILGIVIIVCEILNMILQ